MKIAVARDGEFVTGHFGHCEGFEVFEVNNKNIVSRTFLPNPGHRPGFLPVFLSENNINIIVSGGMGGSAQELFKRNNIEVIVGATGKLDSIINDYLEGKLKSTYSVCHDHEHHDKCGNH